MKSSPRPLREIVLVGGGHAHVQVLMTLAKNLRKRDNVRLTLISDSKFAFYSGMLPGSIAGLYKPEDAAMDLVALCTYTKARWIQASLIGVDRTPGKQMVKLQGHADIPFDILSINIGSKTRGCDVEGVLEHALVTRPVTSITPKLLEFESDHDWKTTTEIVCIGGGAAGIELAFGLKARCSKHGVTNVTLCTRSSSLLPGDSSWVRSEVMSCLKDRHIEVEFGKDCVKVEEDSVTFADGTQRKYDLLMWSTGPAPHDISPQIGLDLAPDGFIAIRPTLQITTDDNIFAAGDCASILGITNTKAGVYAVRQGPVLSQNILKFLRLPSSSLTNYVPQSGFLSLLMTGDSKAIASWKGLSVSGSTIWLLKDKIDQDFMKKFTPSLLPPSPANYDPS